MKEDKEVQKMLEDVVLYKVDAEKGEGPELAKAHKVSGYPTFVLATADVEPIDRWMGYSKPMLDEMLDSSMADLSTIDEKRSRYEKSANLKDALVLARYDGAVGDYSSAVSLYEKAGELDSDSDYSYEIFDATFSGHRRGVEGFDMASMKKTANVAMKTADHGEMMQVAKMMMYSANKAEDHDLMVEYLKTAVEKTADSKDERVQATRAGMMPAYALHVEKDTAKAVDLKKASMPEGWMQDAGQLNSYAWWAFENQVDLENAKTLAEKGVELAPAGKEKAMVLDTLAEICNSLDNCAEAVELIQMAVAEDPENEFYKEQLTRFQEILAKQK